MIVQVCQLGIKVNFFFEIKTQKINCPQTGSLNWKSAIYQIYRQFFWIQKDGQIRYKLCSTLMQLNHQSFETFESKAS